MHLPQDCPDTWDLFVNWLYRSSLNDICAENKYMAKIQLRNYIILYAEADRTRSWTSYVLGREMQQMRPKLELIWAGQTVCEIITEDLEGWLGSVLCIVLQAQGVSGA